MKVGLEPGQTLTYKLPDVKDVEGNDYEIKVTLKGTSSSFVKYQSGTFFMSPL
jgi:hypothetical protein